MEEDRELRGGAGVAVEPGGELGGPRPDPEEFAAYGCGRVAGEGIDDGEEFHRGRQYLAGTGAAVGARDVVATGV
ncbi:hypothetical protein [Streptomyces sp. NPDC058622]|uniref:hypothetical protein n=1 Tax=Streptomyces sp. NPDC058622 TaxID=3346562 RepID=UPI0036493A99